jgi:hypothetical protein
MKIRISKRSLRLRLSPDDVEHLLTHTFLVHDLELSDRLKLSFRLSLRQSPEQSLIETQGSSLQQTLVEVWLPESQYRQWAQSQSTIEWPEIATPTGLKVFIEKDLKPNRP